MQKKARKFFSLILVLSLILTSITGFIPPAFAQSQQTFVETFDNSQATASYSDGSFVGNHGITWSYTHSRNEGDYPIEGQGLMLRRGSDGSITSSPIPGGIRSFSVEMRKAFTGAADRQLELFINGESKGTSEVFGNSSGEDNTIYKFVVDDINVTGNIVIEIKNKGAGATNRQIVIDNITWTSYSSGGSETPQGFSLQHTAVTEADAEKPIDISFSTANNEGTVTTTVYYKTQAASQFISIEPTTVTGSVYSYSATIPGNRVTEDIQYYISASDSNTTVRHPASGVHTITVSASRESISMSEARSLPTGETVTVEGVITGILGNGQNVFFQDETAGLVARLGASTWSSDWEIGDKIQVTGKLNIFRNLLQVEPATIGDAIVVEKASNLPTPKLTTVGEINQSLQGQLLKVEGLEIKSVATGTSYNVVAEDSEGKSIILRVENTVDRAYFSIGTKLSVTAPLGQFNNDYQLMIRGQEDLQNDNKVAPVIATPPAGSVAAGTAIELKTATEEATIYYTLGDGEPNEEYQEPIIINQATTIRARAKKDGLEDSSIATFTYTIAGEIGETLTVVEAKRLPKNTVATVRGIVTAITGSSNREVYIQDETAGLQVNRVGIDGVVAIGDLIEVTGKLDVFRGEIQFVPESLGEEHIKILSQNNDLPEACEVSLKIINQAANYKTVADAIDTYEANKGNTATVRGIVTANLPNGIYAAEVADLIDPSKTFNIQLPAGEYRNEFNPTINPDVVGKIVIVTGKLDNYMAGFGGGQGLRNDGPIFHMGYDVEGQIVTTPKGFEVIGKDAYGINGRDEEGSTYIYTGRAANFDLNDVKVGDWYTVTGIVGYYDRPQLKLLDGNDLKWMPPPGQQDPSMPLVLDPKPADLTTIFDRKPLISAKIEKAEIDPTDIDYNNIKLILNGVEVTPDIDTGNNLVSYQVVEELAYGEHRVTIHVPDVAGKEKVFSWRFTIVNRDAKYNFYFGIPHAHTAYSDGAGTPTQAFEHARNRGLDFLIMTDHSNWFDGVTEGNFAFDAGRNEYVERKNPNTGQESQWWKTRLEAEAINNKYDDFLALRGFEMTSSTWGHMNTINSNTYVEAKRQMVPIREYYDWIIDVSTRPGAKVFSMFNHPNWPDDSFNNLAYVPQLDPYVNGIEVGNGAPPYSYSRAEGHYWRSLDNGWRVGAMNAQDNHAENWGDPDNLTVIIAENLETDTLIDAMNARRMYSTETRSLYLTFKGNGHWMGSVVDATPGESINFEIIAEDAKVPIEKLQLITNGGYILDEMIFSGGTDTATWNPSVTAKGGAEWFVVKVIHSNGRWGHSSPIFTTGGENDLKLTGLTVNPNPTLPGLETTLTATVSNMGIRAVDAGVEVKFYLNNPTGTNNLIGTAVTKERIPAGSSVNLTAKWIPPNRDGGHRIFAVMTDIPNVTTVREISRAVTIVKPIGKKIVIDGSHSNADVPGTVIESIELLRLYGYEAVVNNQKPITPAMLQDVNVLIINTPINAASNYTAEEQDVIAAWVNNGGAIMVANKSNHNHDPKLLNPLMDKIGTTIRFNDDNVYEPEDSDKYTGGMVWSVVTYNLPETQSGLNKNMEGIRIFSGSSLAAAGSGGTHVPLVNNPATGLEILLGGNPTSYNYNPQSGAYVYNKIGELKGEAIPIIAKENVGQGKIVAAGRHFYSDFEIGNDVSNTALTVQVIDWLAGYDRIRTIKDVRENAAEGDIVSVRGVVTAPTDHFFDVIYIQDETSGVNVYGTQTKNNLPLGTEVIVVGQVEYFEGELEITYTNYNYQVLYVGPGELVEPVVLSTADAIKPQYTGMLITTKGRIVEYNQAESYFKIDDGSGTAHIHVDGYVGAAMGRFQLGDYVQVTGNASVGSVGPRIRVRFYEDMELAKEEKAGFQIVTVDSVLINEEFIIELMNATDAEGDLLKGDYTVKIVNNDVELLNEAVTFTDGKAEIPLTLSEVGEQKVVVTIPEINSYKEITLTVIAAKKVVLEEKDGVFSGSLGDITEDTVLILTINNNPIPMAIIVPAGSTAIHIRSIEDTDNRIELEITVDGLAGRTVTLILPKPSNIPDDRVGAFHFDGSVWEFRDAVVDQEGVVTVVTNLSKVAIAEKVDVPQIHTIAALRNIVEIRWNAVGGATYELIRREVASGVETIIPVNGTTYTDRGSYRTDYEYQVRAIETREGNLYQSDLSASQPVTTGPAPSGSSSDSDNKTQKPAEETEEIEEVKEVKEAEETPVVETEKQLTDIQGHWAEAYIKSLVELKAINGYPDNSFRPENNITRAEFVTILIKALGLELQEGKVFDDTRNHWAKEYIATATAHGIVGGYNDTTFGANDLITREQMAIMVVKAMKLEMLPDAGQKVFSDDDKISSWARSYIEIAASHGIISGYPDNSFRPQGNTKRAEAATVIIKALAIK